MGEVRDTIRAVAAPSPASLSIGIFSSDAHGELAWVNPAFTRLAGVSAEEARGRGWQRNIPYGDLEMVSQEWDRCVEAQTQFEMAFEFVHKLRGRPTTTRVLCHADPERNSDGEFTGLVGSLTPLPESHGFEEKILRTFKAISPATGQDFFRSLTKELVRTMDVSYCVIAELDSDTPDQFKVCGMSDHEEFSDLGPYSVAGSPCELVLRDGSLFVPSGLIAKFPEDTQLGELLAESYLGIRLEDSSGKPLGVLSVLDVGYLPHNTKNTYILRSFAARAAAELERNQGLETLRRSEARYRTLFTDSPVPMLEMDFSAIGPYLDEAREGDESQLREWLDARPEEVFKCMNLVRVRARNLAMRKLIGPPISTAQENGIELPLTPVNPSSFKEEIIALANGKSTLEIEARLRTPSGHFIQVALKLLVIPNAGPPLSRVLVSMIDNTQRTAEEAERQQLQAKMQQAQKLESLGVLAGGIAHDFNNLLVGVVGNADLALEAQPTDPELREMLIEIRSAAQYASELSTRMLAYSGGGNFSLRAVDLATLVRETVQLLESSISKKAELDINIDYTLPTVDGDPSPIRQVVMNLVTNASEAMENQPGKLTVRLGQAEFERAELVSAYVDADLPAGKYVFIEVTDTGCGMSADVLQKLFDPFFTTKFTGRGLGMAAVLGIVRAHSGAILIETAPHSGSSFNVLFPLGKLPVGTPDGQHTNLDEQEISQGELILIVDDEEAVRNLASRVLIRAGFDVILAENGSEAVSIYSKNSASIRGVLLDMNMPIMDGLEASHRIWELNEQVGILFSSGYDESDPSIRGEHAGPHSFIQKPYRPKDLVNALRTLVRVAGENKFAN